MVQITKQLSYRALRFKRPRIPGFLFIPLALTLGGCMGVYEGGFECPPGRGVGCKSISEVNRMVNQGDLPPNSLSDLSRVTSRSCECAPEDSGFSDSSSPSEKPQIWYAPERWESLEE